jgi:hypothetical protein
MQHLPYLRTIKGHLVTYGRPTDKRPRTAPNRVRHRVPHSIQVPTKSSHDSTDFLDAPASATKSCLPSTTHHRRPSAGGCGLRAAGRGPGCGLRARSGGGGCPGPARLALARSAAPRQQSPAAAGYCGLRLAARHPDGMGTLLRLNPLLTQ